MKKTVGLLVMAYGTPKSPEDIERYYTHIRRGRKPSETELEELKNRYERIGGLSPLTRITNDQVQALESRLNELTDEVEFKAYLGLKHIEPFIEDTVKRMHQDGIKEAVSLVLTPHYSVLSVKTYHDRAAEVAEELGGLKIDPIDYWYDEPRFIGYWAEQLKELFQSMNADEKQKTAVIFSAHSLPKRILQMEDPYPVQLKETADLIDKEAGIQEYAIGWQSAGKSPEPWLGPDVKDLTLEMYDHKQYDTFIFCPVGFVADHLEVLFDNDIECRQVTDQLGAKYIRLAMPNIHPKFIDALAHAVLQKINGKQ